MKLTVYNRDGADAGRQVELDDAVFGLEPNDHAIWLDVRSIQAAGRQGTHKTKERGEVAKSRRKLYRQKGTGNARAGDAKSPLRKGGGTIFGPKPHKYNVGVNKKTKQLARRSALAHKINESALRVIEDLKLDVPKTREVAGMISGNGVTTGRTLILTNGQDDTFYRSARNLKKVVVKPADQASTLDLLNAKTVFLQEGAVEVLTEALRPAAKASAGDGALSTPPVIEPASAVPADAELPVPTKLAPTTPSEIAPDVPPTDAMTEADDLSRVWGVGPVFSEALASSGITTFAALADADLDTLRALVNATDGAAPIANEESWVEQARLLAAGDTDGHDALVDSLKADSDS